jgi:hypothetical protein
VRAFVGVQFGKQISIFEKKQDHRRRRDILAAAEAQ